MVQLMPRLVFISCFVFASHVLSAEKIDGFINSQNDTTHLELSGLNQWKYQVNAKGTKVLVEVDSLSDKTVKELNQFKSSLVKSVLVLKDSPAGRDTIQFILARPDVEYFDYLTDEPSRLILDFYQRPSAASQKAESSAETEKVIEVANTKKVAKRKPANEILKLDPKGSLNLSAMNSANHGLFDGADPEFERFTIKDYEVSEESIIKSRDRFYIPFPWLFETPRKWQEVLSSANIYQVNPTLSEENKQMRLLEKLFSKNRNQVFLQTANWYLSKYPQTPFRDMISYMRAETFEKIYAETKSQQDFNRSLQAYRTAVEEYPLSPLAEKTSLSLGIKLYGQKDYLASLRAFNQHIENKKIQFSSDLSKDLASLGVALSFMQLQKFDEAVKTLENLKKNSAVQEIKEEASYRIGDLYVQSKKYPEAIQEYTQAQKQFPEAQGRFPNAYFNKAEAQFWLGNYRPSLEDFREYIKKFPSDNHAPLALTRIGENLEILGADRTRVLGAYLEAYFRYGESLNAVVARVRMTAAKMKSMKPKEVELAAQEILSLSKKIDFVDADKLATILISEGYNERGEFDKTLNLLIDYYQRHPMMSQADQFSKRITATINQKMSESVAKKDFINTLKTHQKFSDVWLKNSDRLDTRYFLGASFEQAGAPQQAENYYREVLNRLNSIKGTKKEKEIRVVQTLPSAEAINLRLARALYSQKKYQEAFEAIKQIRTFEGLSEDEQIERVALSVDLLMEKEDLDSSKRFVLELLKNWSGEPTKMIEPYYKLAQVEVKSKQDQEALSSLKRIEELVQDTQATNSDLYFKALQLRLEIAERSKNLKEIVTVSEKILENFEESKPVASIRYKLGDTFAKQGQFKKAEEVWQTFKGPQADFWKKLATEQVNNDAWNTDYKKYRSRIPAMSREGAN